MCWKYVLSIAVLWALIPAVSRADGDLEPTRAKPGFILQQPPAPTTGLYSDDEKALLEYLSQNEVPYERYHPNTGGPLPENPVFVKEVQRAAVLFHTGSAEMRLAIAKAVRTTRTFDVAKVGYQMWAECGPDDWVAKHYLSGIALMGSSAEERRMVCEWLLKSAHPSLASALLKNLNSYVLYEGMSAEEMDAFVPFLRELYWQSGYVLIARLDASVSSLRELYQQSGYVLIARDFPKPGTDLTEPIPRVVVRLLPPTVAGGQELIDWMEADSKKVDKDTLNEMWGRWGDIIWGVGKPLPTRDTAAEKGVNGDEKEHSVSVTYGAVVPDEVSLSVSAGSAVIPWDPLATAEKVVARAITDDQKVLLDRTLSSRAMAESWLLAKRQYGWPPQGWKDWKPFATDFRKRLFEQVFNPDERVQRPAILYAFQLYEEAAPYVAGLQAPRSLRDKACGILQELYAGMMKEGADMPPYLKELKEKTDKMMKALGG